MILDLEGVTSEPTRRRHVVALSAASAAIALALLSALFTPAPRVGPTPLAASDAPSPASMTVFFASDSMTWIRGGPFEESMRDAVASTVCAAGIGSSPPVHLVLDADGRAVAAYTSGATGRFIPLPRVYVGPGWVAVPCDTSDVFAPRLNRAR
jgi:hypothetical protein